MQNLTAKREKFVSGLMKQLSQREAYKQAGYSTKNMANKTIDENASRLFRDSKVRARFNEINSKVVKKAEEKTIANATEVLEFYSDLMRGTKKDVTIVTNMEGKIEEKEVKAQLKERINGADALAKRYGLNEINIKMESKNTLDVSKLSKEQIKELLDE